MGIKGAEIIGRRDGENGHADKIKVTLKDGTVKEFTRDHYKQGKTEVYRSKDGQVISRLENGNLARSFMDEHGNNFTQEMNSDFSSEKILYVNGLTMRDWKRGR